MATQAEHLPDLVGRCGATTAAKAIPAAAAGAGGVQAAQSAGSDDSDNDRIRVPAGLAFLSETPFDGASGL